MSRRRPPSRRGSGRLAWLGIALSVLAASVLVVPSAPYSTADSDRAGSLDVSADETALVGTVTNDSVEAGDPQWLVTVGNNFSSAELDVTVQLTPPARSEGYLLIDGTNVGDEAQFVLATGAEQDVDVCVDDNLLSTADDVTFNVSVEGTGSAVSGTVDERRVPVTDNLDVINCDGLL